ncbi:MAG: SGNH/GDSL hydrolase family protein [Planctomycetales bacterium]
MLARICFFLIVGTVSVACGEEPAAKRAVRVVTLGDSITKGVRTGVAADQTFAALLEVELKRRGFDATVSNVGIGGERTDQALVRLEKDVISKKPGFVTIMYGTNDSYIDPGRTVSRLTAEEYAKNLRELVRRLRGASIEPILMTPPKWAVESKDGRGKNPNGPLEPFVEECRRVARELKVPLVDHYGEWSAREAGGEPIAPITTDGCHPNPEGQAMLCRTILPVLLEELREEPEGNSWCGCGVQIRRRKWCR